MKKHTLFLLFLFPLFIFSQKNKQISKEIQDIKKFQQDLNKEYSDSKETPLRGDNFAKFKQHPFFPIDLKYRVTAKFIKNETPQPFDLPTSSGKSKLYQEFGTATFDLNGKSYTLTIYQSLDLMKMEEYKDHLFLPFRDKTNNKETYGGGKYMDLKIPKGNTIVLDFNQSYQPFCAYNAYDYNCPIVPEENKLPVEIRAGVMYEDIYHH
ncbi:hypothetical protein CHRY9390_00729 [Chryseobacterium aquaeductus]|uniref:DUF1684 domain-containing protein n=1 Tax=Chryseobacterium aquaeductus TaxID=2675056 RepID=A0A9N8MDZ6_9FLAO|nr:DUF1684 domain-containing protein [Chryseobacterium aquaeductus]CAA7330076.1 hypothetical protein CHRY9390_00729 [Chryseobacterium potabilaquae]CAD7801106.1 hypothetical protein CHRY9390_00729 [Chryseobacterium aquaeductus]